MKIVNQFINSEVIPMRELFESGICGVVLTIRSEDLACKDQYHDLYYRLNILYQDAHEHDISIGLCLSSSAVSLEQAEEEKEILLSLMERKVWDLPLFFEAFRIDGILVEKVLHYFLTAFEKNGYYCGIFADNDAFRVFMEDDYYKNFIWWNSESEIARELPYHIRMKEDLFQPVGQLGETSIDYPKIIQEAKLNNTSKLTNSRRRYDNYLYLYLKNNPSSYLLCKETAEKDSKPMLGLPIESLKIYKELGFALVGFGDPLSSFSEVITHYCHDKDSAQEFSEFPNKYRLS